MADDEDAASRRREERRQRREEFGERLRARCTAYMLDAEGRPRRLLWVDTFDVHAPYMSPESPADSLYAARAARPDGRGYEVVLEYDRLMGVWMVRMADGRFRVIPDDAIAENDLDKAREVCERRARFLMRTDAEIWDPHVQRLEDITPRQLELLSRDPLCRQLAGWGRAHGEGPPAWANPPVRRPLVMFVHPDDSYGMGVLDRDRPFYPDMFWAQFSRAAARPDA